MLGRMVRDGALQAHVRFLGGLPADQGRRIRPSLRAWNHLLTKNASCAYASSAASRRSLK
jgi:hypothetical protein